jgi:hypothetical protein
VVQVLWFGLDACPDVGGGRGRIDARRQEWCLAPERSRRVGEILVVLHVGYIGTP